MAIPGHSRYYVMQDPAAVFDGGTNTLTAATVVLADGVPTALTVIVDYDPAAAPFKFTDRTQTHPFYSTFDDASGAAKLVLTEAHLRDACTAAGIDFADAAAALTMVPMMRHWKFDATKPAQVPGVPTLSEFLYVADLRFVLNLIPADGVPQAATLNLADALGGDLAFQPDLAASIPNIAPIFVAEDVLATMGIFAADFPAPDDWRDKAILYWTVIPAHPAAQTRCTRVNVDGTVDFEVWNDRVRSWVSCVGDLTDPRYFTAPRDAAGDPLPALKKIARHSGHVALSESFRRRFGLWPPSAGDPKIPSTEGV